MADTIKAIRGMNDILPEQSVYWQRVERACRALAYRYAYHEIRFPIVESTNLFKRTVGMETDIVAKEMYTFDDRNGDSLSLRPEGTAGCVRAGIEQGLLYNQLQRLWYLGPMFRHERPQKGRYRQFHQFGVEAYGMPGPEIDVEQILLVHRLFKELGLSDVVTLEINNLGSSESRQRYQQELVAYLSQHKDDLDEDSQQRLTSNPLRILDSKNKAMQTLIEGAPKLLDFISEEEQQHFALFRELLTNAGIQCVINPRLVRGLDYYNLTVYEWVTDRLGAQATVCAGGRYDGLVAQLGGKATPAVGFALGLERIVLLLSELASCQQSVDIYLVLCGAAAQRQGLLVAEALRDALPQLVIETHAVDASMKSQFKRADKSGAEWALIMGDDEITHHHLTVKDLRGGGAQQTLSLKEFIQILTKE